MNAQEQWQVSGDAARQYELYVASWFAPWADDLVERAELRSGSRVLDLACGTGIVVRAAAPVIGEFGELVASDLNEDMLTEARTQPIEGSPVQWRVADAEALPFDSDAFDTVLCQQGLQFVPDKAAAVSEMRRVLRPRGSAAVSVWRSVGVNPYLAAMADGLTKHLSTEAGQTMTAPCGFGDRDALHELFAEAGFTSVRVEAVELMRTAASALEAIQGNLSALPIAGLIASMDADDRTRMIGSMLASLDDFIEGEALSVPVRAHVVVATA